jgi:hypothetical protein
MIAGIRRLSTRSESPPRQDVALSGLEGHAETPSRKFATKFPAPEIAAYEVGPGIRIFALMAVSSALRELASP